MAAMDVLEVEIKVLQGKVDNLTNLFERVCSQINGNGQKGLKERVSLLERNWTMTIGIVGAVCGMGGSVAGVIVSKMLGA